MRQSQTENIKNFTQQIEKIYHELTRVQTVGKTILESKINTQNNTGLMLLCT